MRVLCIVLIDLIHMTNDAKVSMPVMADLLADRLRINNWVVAFKALITSHNLITLGNEVITMVTDRCICNFMPPVCNLSPDGVCYQH